MAVCASAIVLAGCSAVTAKPVPAATKYVTVTPEPSATEAAPLALGATATLAGVKVTAYSVNTNSVPPPAPQPESPSDKWVSADVEICNTSPSAFTFSSMPWTLVDSEHRAFQQSSVGYSQFPQPAYAWGDTVLNAGQCQRGWITFVVNQSSTLASVQYANSSGGSAVWNL